MAQLKLVRAITQGFYDGNRRRAGAEFVVKADAKESWFEDVGPAPEGAALPTPLVDGKPAAGKPFIQVMQELGKPQVPRNPPQPKTLREVELDGDSLV